MQPKYKVTGPNYLNITINLFVQNSDEVLNAFHSAKLDDMKSSRKKLKMPRPADTTAFFAKYLTSEKVPVVLEMASVKANVHVPCYIYEWYLYMDSNRDIVALSEQIEHCLYTMYI